MRHRPPVFAPCATIRAMWRPDAEVLTTDLGDELVLMEPVRSVMFSLNESGRLLWQTLPADETRLTEVLRDAYGLDAEQARRDVQVWLRDLSERALIEQE